MTLLRRKKMNKALMISIRPQHAVNILIGKKTLELRTWIPKDYVGWVYVYVTKGKPFITETCDNQNRKHYYELFNTPHFGDIDLNGKVAFRFWFDEYDTLEYIHEWDESDYLIKIRYSGGTTPINQFWYIDSNYLDNLCLDYQDVLDYGFREKPKPHQKTLYAWHIKKLEVFDEPKQLREFALVSNYKHIVEKMTPYEKSMLIFGNTLKKAPQRSVWVYGN